MSIRRTLALVLTFALASATLPAPIAAAPQGNGILGGRANDEAKVPYTDWTVRLRDLTTNQVSSTVPLDAQGRFMFRGLSLGPRFVVELFSVKQNKVVCAEGPFILSTVLMSKTDVNINCGTNPALWWLAAAGGAATAVAVGVRSR